MPPRTARAESQYARLLRGIGKQVGVIVAGFKLDFSALPSLAALLHQYSEALKPWARKVAANMIGEVNDRELGSWLALGNEISSQLKRQLRSAPLGNRVNELLDLQVELITSLPREAAERVHTIAKNGLLRGMRAKELAEQILETGEVTRSRATLIARTEVMRTATVLTQARAEAIGSTHYIWRTAGDSDVRPGHKAMEGKTCEWAHPPAVNENGRIMHHHPGAIWNCRCWPEPVIHDPYQPAQPRLQL